jgi:hypothetical protein
VDARYTIERTFRLGANCTHAGLGNRGLAALSAYGLCR